MKHCELTWILASALGFVLTGCSESSEGGDNAPVAGAGGGAGSSSGGSSSGGTMGGSNSSGSGGMPAGSGGAPNGGAGGSGGASGSGGNGGSGGVDHGKAMSVFVSSTPLSGSGDLGGLAGADAHCKMLAMAAGAVRTEWVAYLSAQQGNVNAKDRIGTGPWYNHDEEVFAANLAALHTLPAITQGDMASRNAYIAAKPADALFMDENGMSVPMNRHDILTGTNPDGTLDAANTCADWTSDSGDDTTRVGHSDTPGNTQFSPSWNAAHLSQGCSAASLTATGGEGRIYCFATD
jgi:hypothetical protein